MLTPVEWSEIARNYGILVGGFAGLAIALWRGRSLALQARAATEQAEWDRRDLVTETFNRAVSQLSDEKLEIRLGAIYTLREICLNPRHRDLTDPIVQTLTAYARERTSDQTGETVTMDIEAIIDLLSDYTALAASEKTGYEQGT